MDSTNELPITTDVAPILEKTNRRRLMQWGAYALITVLAYLLITVIVRTPLYFEHYDSYAYLNLAENIRQHGLLSFYNDFRTYGYPVFLALIQQLAALIAPTAEPLQVIALVQFVLHSGAALLSVTLIEKLSERKTSFIFRITCFALVELNAVLLGLTRDILTESVTVFVIMLFIELLLSDVRLKWALLGLTLGIAIIVRPVHQVWGLAFLLAAGLLFCIRRVMQHGAQSTWNQMRQIDLKRLTIVVLQIAVPLLVIVGLQYFFVYQAENKINLVGTRATELAVKHLNASVYDYKYETYVGTGPHSPKLFYCFEKGEAQATAICAGQDSLNLFQYFVTYPFDTVYVLIVKTVGIFQSYEWSTYRQTTTSYPNLVFIWGLIPLLGLVVAHHNLLRQWRKMLTTSYANFCRILVLVAADLYLVLYILFTIPETRFMAPMLPALTVCGLSTIATPLSPRYHRTLLIIAGLTFIMYMLVFVILQSSLI